MSVQQRVLPYDSRGPATVTLSLSILAEHGGNTAPHKDGWGIAFYDDGDARILKDTESASHSKWVQFVEQQEIRSPLLVSWAVVCTCSCTTGEAWEPFQDGEVIAVSKGKIVARAAM